MDGMAWYGWCPSYPPSVCSVTEGGGVMTHAASRHLCSGVSKFDTGVSTKKGLRWSIDKVALKYRSQYRRESCSGG
jgi:hypothetical protein